MSDDEDLTWTTGKNPRFTHIRLIDFGAFGEVHGLRDEVTSEIFARKLIRPCGNFSKAEVENEVRVVAKLCKPGMHKNIVSALRYGKVRGSPYFFLDMELCDFNLATHIDKWRQNHPDDSVKMLVRFAEIGHIITDISNGIAFIHLHRETHRDLKPRNVLYSFKEDAWKIADFGLTAEATSKRIHSTIFSRGTSGYRAPELVREPANYNNKVDIWALGCTLFELVLLRQAFSNDFAVDDYYRQYQAFGKPFEISVPLNINVFPHESLRESTIQLISTMLEIEADKRPTAQVICERLDVIFGPCIRHMSPRVPISSFIPGETPYITQDVVLLNVPKGTLENLILATKIWEEFHRDFANVYQISPEISLIIPRSKGYIRSIIINNPNTLIAIASKAAEDRYSELTLRESRTGRELWRQLITIEPSPTFTPDGRYLAFCHRSGEIHIVDVSLLPFTTAKITTSSIQIIADELDRLIALAVDPERQRLAIATLSWQNHPAVRLEPDAFRNHVSRMTIAVVRFPYDILYNTTSMSYTRTGKILFVANARCGVAGFNPESGERLYEMQWFNSGHDMYRSLTLGIIGLHNEEILVVGYEDRVNRIRSIHAVSSSGQRRPQNIYEGHGGDRAIISGGKMFICRWDCRRIDRWDGDRLQPHAEFDVNNCEVPSGFSFREGLLTLITSQGACRLIQTRVIDKS